MREFLINLLFNGDAAKVDRFIKAHTEPSVPVRQNEFGDQKNASKPVLPDDVILPEDYDENFIERELDKLKDRPGLIASFLAAIGVDVTHSLERDYLIRQAQKYKIRTEAIEARAEYLAKVQDFQRTISIKKLETEFQKQKLLADCAEQVQRQGRAFGEINNILSRGGSGDEGGTFKQIDRFLAKYSDLRISLFQKQKEWHQQLEEAGLNDSEIDQTIQDMTIDFKRMLAFLVSGKETDLG